MTASPKSPTASPSNMNEPYDIIDTVRLTEKATLLAEKENKYVFRVKPHANKTQIKQAIELNLGYMNKSIEQVIALDEQLTLVP